MSRSYHQRTRTGMGIAKGNLREYNQNWMVTLLHPSLGMSMKLEISSEMRKITDPREVKEYMSLRFEDLSSAKPFLISLLLAMREYVKYSPDEKMADFSRWIEKVPDMVMSGHFDEQMHVYGYSQEETQKALTENKVMEGNR